MNLYDVYEQMDTYTNNNQEFMILFNLIPIHEKSNSNIQIKNQTAKNQFPSLCTNTNIKPTNFVN